jgi:phospholipase C
MMENWAFDHMLGALKKEEPHIDGLTGNESNPDMTGAKVTVQPLARGTTTFRAWTYRSSTEMTAILAWPTCRGWSRPTSSSSEI